MFNIVIEISFGVTLGYNGGVVYLVLYMNEKFISCGIVNIYVRGEMCF